MREGVWLIRCAHNARVGCIHAHSRDPYAAFGSELMKSYRKAYEGVLGELPEENNLGEVSVLCPFHEDHRRSASINLKRGLYHCMACETSYNFSQFKKAYTIEHGYVDPAPEPEAEATERSIPDQVARDYHFALLENQPLLDLLRDKRGINVKAIRKWQIGWQQSSDRIAIPIRDQEGTLRNIRLYSFTKSGQQKMLSWRSGYGSARLWPYKILDPKNKYVFLCEGEMDRLILEDRGLNAVTSTGGAKTWKSEWSPHFSGLKVYVIYDMDDAGDEGARKAAASVAEYASEVRICRLDLEAPGEDVTDFFVNYGFDVSDLKQLVKQTPKFRKPIKVGESVNGQTEWVSLGQSLQDRHHGRELMVPVIVSARRDERLHYPRETMFVCDQSAGKMCNSCNLMGTGEATVRVEPDDPRLIDFVGVPTRQQRAITRARAGIPSGCRVVQETDTEAGRLEEILITPEIDTASVSDDSMHLIQRGFYVGVGLDYNASYVIRTRPTPFHKTSKLVHHVIAATPAQDSIESFEMSDELHDRLKIFQARPGRAKKKLWDIATDLQNHVTRIWDRLPMHIGMDLVWHSVLEFEFDGKLERRGWLEACIVGDTRTGKSEVATQLRRHYGYGEIVSGENTSFAGLVGGAIKYDDAWFVKWGRLPLNDRRMVIIDEVTGMSVDDIALMSGVRESGIADITKIETQRAPARTRSLWIGNVRPPRQDLSDFDYGCLALHDLIGQPEDIARFDYAMSAARDEVSPRTVNMSHPIGDGPRYDTDSCASLVLWAWSRGRDTVQFQRDAVQACFDFAIQMGERYTSSLPLVMAENQRVKLARISVAVAARLYSTDDGENLIVTAEHVGVARDLLNLFYGSPSFGYSQYSAQRLAYRHRRQSSRAEVEEFLSTRALLADHLSRSKLTNVKKISDYTGLTETESKEVLLFLTRTMMLEDKGSHGYGVSTELRALAERTVPLEYQMEE